MVVTVDTEALAHPLMIWIGHYLSRLTLILLKNIVISTIFLFVLKIAVLNNLFFHTGAARFMTSATVMPCSIRSAGPSWITLIPRFTPTPVMRLTESSLVQVS